MNCVGYDKLLFREQFVCVCVCVCVYFIEFRLRRV